MEPVNSSFNLLLVVKQAQGPVVPLEKMYNLHESLFLLPTNDLKIAILFMCLIISLYSNFEFLIPDAPELVANFLDGEQDMSCKRNAFLMLLHAEQERAHQYLAARLDQVHGFGDILQLVIVELIYKVRVISDVCRSIFKSYKISYLN